MVYISKRSPRDNVTKRICKYIVFDILMACLPLFVDLLICFAFDLSIEDIYDYSIQICVMTIVLSATSIKGAIENRILRKKPGVFWAVVVSSIFVIAVSLLMYGIMEYDVLSTGQAEVSKQKPFYIFLCSYILSLLLGFLVQIGGGIND